MPEKGENLESYMQFLADKKLEFSEPSRQENQPSTLAVLAAKKKELEEELNTKQNKLPKNNIISRSVGDSYEKK